MKVLLTFCMLFSLAACGGGCGGGGGDSSGASQPAGVVSSSTESAPSLPATTTVADRPVVDYAPTYLALVTGSYNVLCGRNDRPRIATSVKISAVGLLTPWRGKSLDLNSTMFSFSRSLGGLPADDSIAAIGGFTLAEALWSVTSKGAINSGDLSPSAVADLVLGSGDLLGLDPKFASVLSCDGSTEAAALLTKSAYTAFAKFIDAPKTALLCLAPNSTTGIYSETSNETYEISNGELRFKGQTISLLSGIKKELIGDVGGLKPVVGVSGATIYTRFVQYTLDKLDGTSIGLTINEYGETTALSYKFGTGPLLSCLRKS